MACHDTNVATKHKKIAAKHEKHQMAARILITIFLTCGAGCCRLLSSPSEPPSSTFSGPVPEDFLGPRISVSFLPLVPYVSPLRIASFALLALRALPP